MISDVTNGLLTCLTTFTITSSQSQDVILSVILSLVSAIVYTLFNLGIKVLTNFLKKKGLLTDDEKEKIEDIVEDFSDNGKLDNSNKK